jgi:hypothetical protein
LPSKITPANAGWWCQNRAQTDGQDMAQIAPDELDPGECERFDPVVIVWPG